MKFYKIVRIVLIISTFLITVSFANNDEKITQKDIVEQNEMSQPIDPSDKIEEWADSFLEKMGIDSFGEVDGKYFYFAQAATSKPSTDPQFGDALVNAYDKAFFDIMEQYALDMYGRETVEQIRSFFQNSSTNARNIELPTHYGSGFWDKVLAILNKNLDLIGKKLDQKLIELGVDPKELERMSPKMKKTLFKDKFIKNTITKASGDISGIFTIQSSWASDKNGNYVVGVIAVVSPKTKQIAEDIRYQRDSLIVGKGRDINSLIPKSAEKLKSTLGTRLVYDKDGSPAIISYGISSYISNSKDYYVKTRLKQEAYERARSNADAQIAMIVNGYLSTKTSRKSGEKIENYVERELKADSETIEKTIRNIVNITNKNAKATASMRLQGVSTARKWRYTLPTGQKMVGVVRVWKYSTLNTVKKFKSGYKRKEQKVQLNENFEESEIVNDINDF